MNLGIYNNLFSRYVPKDNPPSQVFKDPLVRVDVSIKKLNRSDDIIDISFNFKNALFQKYGIPKHFLR